MTQIDTSKWGKFKVGDLFEIKLSKNDLKIEECNTGSTPLISAGNENNGIVGYINREDFEVFPANSITVDMFGKVFVQTKDFCAVSHGRVNILIPKYTLSLPTLFFIVSVLQREIKDKFDFANMCTSKKISKQNILLPIIFSGSPDWQYMEDYMKEITKLAAKRVEKLKEENPQTKIDTSNWKKFKVGELFEFERGKEVAPNKNLSGDCPLILESGENNGYSRNVISTKIFDGNAITVSVNYAANVFYQENKFCASVNIIILRNKYLNKHSGLFIAAILSKNNSKYNYNDKISKNKLFNETIPLPVTPEGTPDFDYMENYMKEITEKAKKKLSNIPQ